MDTPPTGTPSAPAAPPPAKRRSRWLRRTLYFVVGLLVLVALAPLALSLPPVRDLVAKKAGEALGKPVTIRSASAFWGKGVDLEGIVVESGPGFDGPLATVEKVHATVDLLGLLGGTVSASVDVTKPDVTFRRDAAGRGNAEGLFPSKERKEPSSKDASETTMDVRLAVTDGAVRSADAAGKPGAEVTGIDATVRMNPAGDVEATFDAVAKDARPGGGDAPIQARVLLAKNGDGPLRLDVPSIDLARLSSLVEDATGTTITGRFEAKAEGTTKSGSEVAGTFHLVLERFAAKRRDGTAVTVERLEGTVDGTMGGEDLKGTLRLSGSGIGVADEKSRYGIGELAASATFAGGADTTNGTVDVTLRRVSARVRTDEGERALDEPEVRAVSRMVHGNGGRLQIDEATVNAGTSLVLRTTEAWRIDTSGATPRATGKATMRADVGRLTALRSFAPALASLTAGTIDVTIDAAAAEGLDVGAAVQARGLTFAPGAWAPQGYVEPDALVRFRFSKPSGADPTLRIHDLRSSVVQIPLDPQKKTLDVTLGDAVGFAGPIHVVVNLDASSRAFAGLLGVPKGERLGGEIRLDGSGNGTPESGGLQATIAGRNLVFPPSWGAGGPPANLDASLTVAFRRDGTDVKVADLRGTGLDLDAAAVLSKGEKGGLDTATVSGTIDLGAARPWFEPFAKLGRDATLAGLLTIDTRIAAEAKGRRVKGSVKAQNVRFRKEAAGGTLEEPSLTLEHDVFVPTGDGRYAFDALRLVASSISAEITGGATSSPEGMDLDAALRLNGDAGRLSAQLRPFLGTESDLQGSGALKGSVTLKGSTAKSGRTLLVNGDVDTGRWATGGFTIERAKLTLKRPTAKDLLAVGLDAGVNTGTAQFAANLDLARDGTPWGAQVTLKAVDMSTVVVDKGPGRLLTFVLPAVLPANSTLPVLSGRLDASIQMSAASLDAPKRDDTLRGTGTVRMSQGAVKESTLFKSVGGGGLGEVGRVLATAVPEVGQELTGLMRIAAFSTLLSEFDVGGRVVTVKNARLDSERTSIQMQGRVTFEKQTDLAANLVFSGTAGDRLAKVLPSKTIPLRITGPLEDPRVLPNISAKDLLTGGVVNQLPGLLDKVDPKNPLKGLKDLLK